MTTETIPGFERGTDPSLADDPALQLTRIFVYFLQNLHATAPDNMGMKWRPDEDKTELIISAEKPRLTAVEKMPHITCVLGAGRWGGLGLDQLQSAKPLTTGERVHTDLLSSTVSYHCQAREGLMARRIAWYGSFWTNVFRRKIMRGGGLHHVGVQHDISAESPPSAYVGDLVEGKVVSVTVTIPFYWQPQWLIRDPATLWRQMVLSFSVNAPTSHYRTGDAARIRSASIKGVPLTPVPPVPPEPSLKQVTKFHKFQGEE